MRVRATCAGCGEDSAWRKGPGLRRDYYECPACGGKLAHPKDAETSQPKAADDLRDARRREGPLRVRGRKDRPRRTKAAPPSTRSKGSPSARPEPPPVNVSPVDVVNASGARVVDEDGGSRPPVDLISPGGAGLRRPGEDPTAAEVEREVIQIRRLLGDFWTDREICRALKLTPTEFADRIERMRETDLADAERLSTETMEAWLRAKIVAEGAQRRLREIATSAAGAANPSAKVGAARAMFEIQERLLDRGAELGVLRRAPVRHEILFPSGGVTLDDVLSELPAREREKVRYAVYRVVEEIIRRRRSGSDGDGGEREALAPPSLRD